MLTPDRLTSSKWRFGEQGSWVFWSTGLQFLPDGSIAGYQHRHERYWSLEDNILYIFAEDGRVTWNFRIESDENGIMSLAGAFRLDSSFTGVGALVEIPSAVNRQDLTALPYIANGGKVAVLVLAHSAPRILDAVAGMFDPDRFHFFIHVDAKQNLEKYKSEMKNTAHLTFVENRIAVFWGGFSMIEAEIVLAEAALLDPAITCAILISDDAAPVVSPVQIYNALAAIPNRITCVANGRPLHWYREFYYADCKFSGLRGDFEMDQRQFTPQDFAMLQRLEALRAKGKKEIQAMYFGRQWWALSRAVITDILSYIKQDDHLVESFRFSLFPDETFFPTVFRICFPSMNTLDIPTYADYGRHVHPWKFSSAAEIRGTKFDPEHLFIRKILPHSPEIITALAEGWK